ncbi:hypothetical protein WMY93_022571 [Mugilogobius chulae]|uniref:ABC transporter domain-containing protein n=1 Tax=Mugilogobius chulae TaxID=88201 RepID=A0AAW0NJN1_9GOBI
MASFFCASKIVVFFTFTTYVLLGNTLSASRVFVTVSLYSAEFLQLDEVHHIKAVPHEDNEKPSASVDIKDLKCFWDKTLETPTLQSVSLTLKSDQLLAVIGPVGSGKSSLLSSILGELSSEHGVMEVKGQLTYASQQPWVFPGTIRSNILFGKELNPQKYERVLRACALKRVREKRQAMRSGVDFTSLLQKEEEEESQMPGSDTVVRNRTLSQNSALSQASSVTDGDELPAEPVQTVVEESRAQGTIKVSLYIKYLRAGANILVLVFMLLITFWLR